MNDFWNKIRNFAALVGLISGLYAGYTIFVDRYDLKATADTSEFHFPKKINSTENDSTNRYNSLIDITLSEFPYLSYKWKNQTIINISNEGNKEIEDINLLTNGIDCNYQFEDSEGEFKSGQSTSKIALGNLLANEKIRVIVWHSYTNPNNEFSISFPEGSFDIEYSQKFNGLTAIIANFIGVMGYGLIPIIIYFIIGLFSSDKSNNTIRVKTERKIKE